MTPTETGEALRAMIAEELTGSEPLAQRIIANRVLDAVREFLPKPSAATADLPPMTDQQAHAFGEERITFGAHAGQRFSDVPLDYLAWLADSSRTLWRNLHGYLRSYDIQRERDDCGDDE